MFATHNAEKEKAKSIKDKINLELIEQIQAAGGIHFRDEKYICTGTGYEVCIHVYTYSNNIDEFWLTYITGLSNVVVTMDVSTEDLQKVQDNINKNIKEQAQRVREARDYTSYTESMMEKEKNELLLRQLVRMDDVVRIIAIRIFVPGKTKEKVDEAAVNIINHLNSCGYKSSIFLNESAHEWRSMYYSYKDQLKLSDLYKRVEQPVLSSTLAKGNPFHFSSLSDDFGSYWGDTDVGGTVLFDPFHLSSDRKYYNIAIFGNMGSGKSTTLKKLIKDQAIRGNYIRGFDITGEFTDLIRNLGGKIISLDGTDGIINPLEIFQSGDTEKINWQNHVSKLSTMYEYMVPNVSQYELSYFQLMLKKFYNNKTIGLYPDDESALSNATGIITSLNPERYPLLDDFRDFLVKLRDNELVADEDISCHRNIILIIENLVENFGSIFNGYTSMKDVLNERILYFNISSVLKVDPRILDTILFNILSLCWDNLLKIGSQMKKLYDSRQIDLSDVTRFLIIIDEAHRIVNANKMSTVQQILGFEREARKYFGGIALATQSIRDYVPEGTSDAALNQIKLLFELSQYKIAMEQDTNVVTLLKNIFSGQLTDSMIEQIPRLSKGEAILALSSRHSLKFKIRISETEKMLFAGGA